ncbi:2'-5' RNA ligase [Halalkalibacter wakoensis JCM 9140]|uniref:RNA 2',3'-cyclic phosphodiesterase n=1 Tax=Halalkalibacter wakoensis JCM 9140 TaxID=1236970 RepID=W4Q335_9BACI|nr:RNA 2',3'-cyclic phosphodiesterase [Halalkalibacter wakoensis]GAE25784.1 2'-5' RNA ligase [Halalkalibacter wakoensis JCM 9140]
MQSHYFLAVPLSDELKKQINESVSKADWPFKSWVHEQDLHLTLVFLGACTEDQLKDVKKVCNEVVSTWNPFSLELTSFGTFGQKEHPRVFWIGVREEQKLAGLQHELFRACSQLGFELDKRAFSPHITVARKWVSKETYVAQENPTKGQRWSIDNIVLYKSVVTETPKYKVEQNFKMKDES